MPKDSNDETKQHPLQVEVGSKLYWGLIVVGGIVTLLLAWWLMIKVGTQVHALRQGLFPFIKWMLIIGLVVIIGVSMFVAIVNITGKQQEYNANLPEDEDDDDDDN